MTYYSAPKFWDLSDPTRLDPRRSRPEPTTAAATPRLTPGAGLILALLLSLGLWAAIWEAGSSLALAWPR